MGKFPKFEDFLLSILFYNVLQKALSEFKRTYCGKKNDYVKNKLEMLPWRTEAFTENKLKIISVYVR